MLQVISELYQLESDSQQLEQMLKSKLGTLVYLENLQREGDTSTATCPICRNIFTDKVSLFISDGFTNIKRLIMSEYKDLLPHDS